MSLLRRTFQTLAGWPSAGPVLFRLAWRVTLARTTLPLLRRRQDWTAGLLERFEKNLQQPGLEMGPASHELFSARNLLHEFLLPTIHEQDHLVPKGLMPSITDVTGLDRFQAALAGERGVILVHVHLCFQYMILNWIRDALALKPFMLGKRTTGMRANERSVHLSRELLRAREALSEGGIVQVLPDGYQGRSGTRQAFLGRQRKFVPGFAILAAATGAPVLPAWMVLQRDGRFELQFGEAFPSPPVGAGGKDRQAHYLEAYIHWAEATIRCAPDSFRTQHVRRYLQAPPAN